MNELRLWRTRDHAVEVLDVFLGYSALSAHFVDEASHKSDHRMGQVAVLRILKAAFCVEALSDTASDAINEKWYDEKQEHVTGQAAASMGRCESCVSPEVMKEQWAWHRKRVDAGINLLA